jgi:hypothetical protein
LVPGYFGGHFLGKSLDPFMPGGDPNQTGYSVRNLDLAQGLTMPQLEDRQTLRHRFDTITRALEENPLKRTMDGFDGQALEFLQRRAALEAFQIERRSFDLLVFNQAIPSEAFGVGQNPNPISAVHGANVGSRYAMPLRIIPDLGQV